MLLGHQYYDPAIGRFISQDPAQDESNWYSYCGNNPLVAVDPTGLILQTQSPNYSSEEQAKVDEAIKQIDSTNFGHEQLQNAIASPDTIQLTTTADVNAHVAALGGQGGVGPETLPLPVQPGQQGQTILIGMDFSMGIVIKTTEGPRFADLSSIIVHELGHALNSTGDTSITSPRLPHMDQVIRSENHYRFEAGLPLRIQYAPIGMVPTAGWSQAFGL